MSAAPLVWREPVQDAWIDYNGHLSEAYYVLVLGHATDAVMDAVGLGADYREANDASLYTVEAHIRYLDEVSAGNDLEVRSSVIGVTPKLMWIWHELWADDRLRATEEILGVHVRGGSSAPFPPEIAERARDLCVEPPAEAGRSIRLPTPTTPTTATPGG
jgi:acyl-CoA thioester hydrolase